MHGKYNVKIKIVIKVFDISELPPHHIFLFSFCLCIEQNGRSKPAMLPSDRCMRLTAAAADDDDDPILFCFCHVLFLLCFLPLPWIRRTKQPRSSGRTSFVLPCLSFSSIGWWSHLTLVSSISGFSSRLRLQHIYSPSPTTPPHPPTLTLLYLVMDTQTHVFPCLPFR
jgi:hypothetical protein